MGLSVREAFEAVGLSPSGPMQWGTSLGSGATMAGIYVVASTGNPEEKHGVSWPGCDMQALDRWLAMREGKMTLDGVPAKLDAVAARLSDFWYDTEPIVYIGQTEGSLARRTIQFVQQILGKGRPHRGGHWVHALANPQSLSVFWAVANDPKNREAHMLAAFRVAASFPPRESHHLRAKLALPFANLEYDKSLRKPHGFQGQTD